MGIPFLPEHVRARAVDEAFDTYLREGSRICVLTQDSGISAHHLPRLPRQEFRIHSCLGTVQKSFTVSLCLFIYSIHDPIPSLTEVTQTTQSTHLISETKPHSRPAAPTNQNTTSSLPSPTSSIPKIPTPMYFSFISSPHRNDPGPPHFLIILSFSF